MRPPRASLLWGNEKAGILNKTTLVLVSGATVNARRWFMLCVWSSLSRVLKLSTSLCRFSSSSRQSLEPKLSKKKRLHCRHTCRTLKKWIMCRFYRQVNQWSVFAPPPSFPMGCDVSTSPPGCLKMPLWWCVPSDCWAHVQPLSPTAPFVCLLQGFVLLLPSACTLRLERQGIYK